MVCHKDPSARVTATRRKLESSIEAWIIHHGGEAFSSPFSADHRRVLAKIDTAVNKGGLFALAMPRGHGKTTILKWVTLYVLLTGRRKYVVCVAATSELAQVIIEFCRQQILESDSLHEHYPHVTTYARATGGKAIKARYQLRSDGKTSGIQWSKTTLVLPEVLNASGKAYPSNGAILEGHGLTGAIRGKWRDTKTGKVLRPDFVLLDDPQSRESAESVSQCAMRERIITGDVLGLAGPRKKIAAVMPCTIIRKGDLADRFLDHDVHPEWQGETCRLVYRWPDAQKTLWKEYTNIYKSDGGLARATEYYEANRAAMDAGSVVSWPERVRDGEVSAIQTAENLLLESGPQFWAEYQNEPLAQSQSQYELTPQIVASRVSGFPRLTAPHGIDYVVAAADVNYVGLNWVILAATRHGVVYVVAYGCYTGGRPMLFDPKTEPKQLEQAAIQRGCLAWMKEVNNISVDVAGKHQHVSLAAIDCGNWSDTIIPAVYSVRLPVRFVPIRGAPAMKYRPQKDALKVGDGWHVAEWRSGKVVVINADLYRETVQRAFLAEPGNHGSISLFAPERQGQHMDFAEEVCGETLVEHVSTDKGDYYKWTHQPGQHWDKLDALAYARALLAVSGLSASGMPIVRKRYVERRKARVMVDHD
jgi:hypothetical protein